MSADGLASIVSGVDLALVSWMDGPVVDLSSMNTGGRNKSNQQRIGRCLCSKDIAPSVQDGSVPLLKPTLKKPTTKTLSIDRHIVPQVVEVVGPNRTKHGPVSRTNSEIVSRTGVGNVSSAVITKPILSRKNWNNTIDVSGVGRQQHQPSCLRRYGSQQSCKSATTLRSYVASSSTSRGMKFIYIYIVQCHRSAT